MGLSEFAHLSITYKSMYDLSETSLGFLLKFFLYDFNWFDGFQIPLIRDDSKIVIKCQSVNSVAFPFESSDLKVY